jgi:hypothetical protein
MRGFVRPGWNAARFTRRGCASPQAKEPEMPAIPVFVRTLASWLLLAASMAACAATPPRTAEHGGR